MSEAARSHRSEVRVEPYMEPPAGLRSDAGDPLAELAQLVGQDDPFRNMFRKGKPDGRSSGPAIDVARRTPERAYSGAAETYATDAETEQDRHWAAEEARALGLRPSSHDEEEGHQADGGTDQWDEPHDRDQAAYASDGGYGDETHEHHSEAASLDGPHYAASPLTPDLWAERSEAAEALQHASPALSDEAAADARSPRRPLIVLVAVLALTGGGLAATFLSRPSQGGPAAAGVTPTIMAASGPTKVKQTDGPSEAAPVDADAALLSTKVGSSGPVRVVNSQEQPIDLAQLPKSPGGSPDASGSNASSPFPEPRKVKTFLVRPDGSLLNSAAAAPAPARAAVPQMAAMAGQTDGAAPTPAARPSTPKTGNHGSATPKAAPASIADIAAAEDKQPASPASKPGTSKPIEMAEASTADATASTGSGGNFALQLAASPNEEDARAAFTRLQKKYSELGAFQPTVKKVDNGQKTVYRLRVGNLSQDQAKTLCSHMQANGGSCFVVHN